MKNKIDHWYEEDEEVFVHPRDPYHRIDILESSRHVKVRVNGELVAETERPKILFETGLPPRYYIPPEDVREDVLLKSEKTTRCPYKGIASYWSVEAGSERVEDLIWSYPEPIPEAAKIEGYLCFFNEKVDLEVDGEEQERPRDVMSVASAWLGASVSVEVSACSYGCGRTVCAMASRPSMSSVSSHCSITR